jgi:hypothetical protein
LRLIAFLTIFIFSIALLLPSLAEAGALSVVAEVRAVAADLANEAKTIKNEEKAAADRRAAEAALRQLEKRAAEAEAAAQAAEKRALETADAAAAAEAKARELTADAAAAKKAADEAAQAAARAAASVSAAQREANAIAKSAAAQASRTAEQATAEAAAASESKLQAAADRAQDIASKAYNEADAAATAAFARVDRIAAQADALDARANVLAARADSRAAVADAAVQAADMAKTAAEDARAAAADAKMYAADLKKEAASARTDLERPEEPAPSPVYAQTGTNFYRFKSSAGNSGYQYVTPFSFYTEAKGLEYGLRTAYVVTDVSGAVPGRMASWTDTSLSLARATEKTGGTWRYSLDVNLPTGKATLTPSQQKAVVNDDLFEYSSFGSGTDLIPGIAYTRKPSRRESWSLGTSYAFRGRYDPDGNGAYSPGGEWHKSFEWRYIGSEYQLRGKLAHTSYGTTSGPTTFRQGSLWDASLVYVRQLPANTGLMLYYWYSRQGASSSLATNDSQHGRYFGGAWSKTMSSHTTLRLTFDAAIKSGNNYDPIEPQLTTAGRTKYAWGVGWDVALAHQRQLSFDLQRFSQLDKATTPGEQDRSYTGYNFRINYLYQF